MMDLSIIVPAYNASITINDTLFSLENIIMNCSGKVIVVDDGSTDDTIKIIKKWKRKLNDKLLFLQHKENLGGGAARNTGINAAETTYVLICDSDDISDFQSVKKLYNTASSHEWGSAHYQYAHYFRKRINKIDSTDDYIKIFNSNEIFLETALLKSLLVNFLFKKENWLKAGYYPEHHGWDTQGFSIRYLLNNPGVIVAADTFYYHRRFFANFSYFERENLSGRTFLNSWLSVEEMIGKIPDSWFNDILSKFVLSKEISIDVIMQNVNKYKLKEDSAVFINDNSDPLFPSFVKGVTEFREGKFDESLETLKELFANHYPSEIILYTLLRSLIAHSCKDEKNSSSKSFDYIKNIGQNQPNLRTSRLEVLKNLFKIN